MLISKIINEESIQDVRSAYLTDTAIINSIHKMLEKTFDQPFEKIRQNLLTMHPDEAIAKGHQIFKTDEFRALYLELVAEIAAHLNLTQISFQKCPTFRFQCPGKKSVSFHTDDLSSGHPPNIINVWIPLTSINTYNSIHFVSKDISSLIKNKFINECHSIDWLDSQSRQHAKPWLHDIGTLLLFSNKTLHGTIPNSSAETRISIDFRITDASLPNEFSNSAKSIPGDYLELDNSMSNAEMNKAITNINLPSHTREAISVVYSSARARHLNHPLQRSIVNAFASRNGFEVVREVGEWHCSHYPILNDLCRNHPDKAILIATSNSFDTSNLHYFELMSKLRNHKSGAYFCFEDLAASDT